MPVPRTPDRIKSKAAEKARNACVGIGIASGLVSWGAFQNDAPLAGLGFAGGALVLGWAATKIRVWREKVAEAAAYRPR